MKKLPALLRTWFIAHFVIDMLFGVPLLFFPEWILGLFGIAIVSTLTARLVGAALIAIGGISFVVKNEDESIYRVLLTFKIIWSLSAMIAILLYMREGGNYSVWALFVIFLIFNFVWTRYRSALNKS